MRERGFVDHVVDLLSEWGGVTSRGMFGGHGIYRRGVIFGLVLDDVLYLKTDEVNRPQFVERGLGPFVYQGQAKPVTMSYWESPSECLDDPDELRRWSESALAASLRQKKPPPKKKKKKKKVAKRSSRR